MAFGALVLASALTAAAGAVLRVGPTTAGRLPPSPGPDAAQDALPMSGLPWEPVPEQHALPMSGLPWETDLPPKTPQPLAVEPVEPMQLGSPPGLLEDSSGHAGAQSSREALLVGMSTTPCHEEFAKKQFDVIVYGANGFVGRLAAKYLATLLPSETHGTTWVAADRNPQALTQTLTTMLQLYEYPNKTQASLSRPTARNQPMGVYGVKLDDLEGMLNMARHARVILSFAGPYQTQGGEELIRAAINGCAHYVDVSTEVAWQAKMQKKYEFFARSRGLAVVQSAGFHSMAADVVAVAATRALKQATSRAAPGRILLMWSALNSETTGGQAKTEFVSQANGLVADPYVLAPETPPELRVDAEPDGFSSRQGAGPQHGWDPVLQMSLTPFSPSSNPGGHCPVVRLSMRRLFPDKAVSVLEAKNASLDTQLYFYKRDWRRKEIVDKLNQVTPGRGPPVWLRQAGSAKVAAYAYAEGSGSPEAVVSMQARGDPSSVATPRMAVELAQGLATKGPLNGQGGFLTPATAIDFEYLQERLMKCENTSLLRLEKWTFGHQ